jgi:hypothetical protein
MWIRRTGVLRLTGLGLAAGLWLGLSGCGAAPRQMRVHGTPLQGHPRIALLPLENLSAKPDAGSALTRTLFVELIRTGTCDVVESGEVDAAMDDQHILNSGSVSTAQLKGLSEKLRADFVMLGSLLEYGMTKTGSGEVPTVGMALKLLDGRTGKVMWAGIRTLSGDDKETIFGWGVQHDPQALTERLISELLADFPALAGDGQRGAPEGVRK